MIAVALRSPGTTVEWAPCLAAFAVVLIALAILLTSDRRNVARSVPLRSYLLPALLLAIVFVEPTGLELSGSWLSWPPDPRWTKRWDADPQRMQALQLMPCPPTRMAPERFYKSGSPPGDPSAIWAMAAPTNPVAAGTRIRIWTGGSTRMSRPCSSTGAQ